MGEAVLIVKRRHTFELIEFHSNIKKNDKNLEISNRAKLGTYSTYTIRNKGIGLNSETDVIHLNELNFAQI